MRPMLATALLVIGLALPAGLPAELGPRVTNEEPWIHVEVVEDAPGGTNVKINLPLALVETALDLAPDHVIAKGRLELEHADVTVADLRRLWTQLRAAGDAEFVTIEEKDETVRLSRVGGRLLVQVHEVGEGAQKVRLEVPIDLVDALLSGEGESLNLSAAFSRLQTLRGEILSVEDGPSRVRVWIDERKEGAR